MKFWNKYKSWLFGFLVALFFLFTLGTLKVIINRFEILQYIIASVATIILIGGFTFLFREIFFKK